MLVASALWTLKSASDAGGILTTTLTTKKIQVEARVLAELLAEGMVMAGSSKMFSWVMDASDPK